MNRIDEGWGEGIRALNAKALDAASCTSGNVQAQQHNVTERNNSWNGILKFRRAVLFLVVLLALSAGLISSRAGDAAPSEAQMKAAFLLNFLRYVEWPAAAFPESNSPMVVGVFESEEVAGEFCTMSQGKVLDRHPVQFVRVTSIPQCRNCHILFIGFSITRKFTEILSALQGANVLTVGESDDFTDRGGMIDLARCDRRIVLEMNLDATRRSQLKISSKLMALATVKGGKK